MAAAVMIFNMMQNYREKNIFTMLLALEIADKMSFLREIL
jgi:hypothetical protein